MFRSALRYSSFSVISALALLFMSTASYAQDKVVSGEAVSPEFIERLTQRFLSVRPELKVASVEHTEVDGLYLVKFDGKGSVYVLGNGQYFFTGDLIHITDKEFVNVKEKVQRGPRKKLMASLSTDDMVVFSPKGETKKSIWVFTDVDCGYCRKLHREVGKLNALGIEVKYLAYPRAGIGSPSYDKIASAWCSKDPNKAIDTLKSGQSITINVCNDNPVAKHFRIGGQVGVTGTPAIVLDSGELMPGYLPAEKLAAKLGIL